MPERKPAAWSGRERRDGGDLELLRQFLSRWGWRLVGGYLILLTVGVIGLALVQSTSNTNARRLRATAAKLSTTEQRLRASQLRTCHRLNLVRAEANVTGLVAWRVLTESRHFARDRRQLRWIPLTPSCVFAVDHADEFQPPTSVLFEQRRPTAKDLDVGPDG